MTTFGDRWENGLVGLADEGWYVSKATSEAAQFDVEADWSLQIEHNGFLVGKAAQTECGRTFASSFDSEREQADFRQAVVRQGLIPDDALLEPEDALIALAFAHQHYVAAKVEQAPAAGRIDAARERYVSKFSHDFGAAPAPSVTAGPHRKGGGLGL